MLAAFAELDSVRTPYTGDGTQITLDGVIEIEGRDKPAWVQQSVLRF
jgi:hypothetical protein